MPERSDPDVVAVAIVSWNTRSYLARCLESLQPALTAGQVEVWVIDNGSSDGSPELVESQYPAVRLVRAASNLGFGRAINEVAQRVTCVWLAIANADIAVTPGALDALLAAGQNFPRAGAVAPQLILPDGSIQRSVFSFPRLATTVAANVGLHRVRDSWARQMSLEARWDPTVLQQVDYAMGAFLLLRREAFDSVQGFDSHQWLFAEDMDLCWRLRRNGWSTLFTPHARILHVGGASTGVAFAEDETLALKLGALYAWLQHRRGLTVSIAFATVNVAGAAARYIAALFFSALAPNRFTIQPESSRSWLRITTAAWSARQIARRGMT